MLAVWRPASGEGRGSLSSRRPSGLYSKHAATEKTHAARVAAEAKKRTYAPLLRVGDELLVPAAETHGGIHPAFRSALGKLAGAVLGDEEGGEAAHRRHTAPPCLANRHGDAAAAREERIRKNINPPKFSTTFRTAAILKHWYFL